VPSNYGTLKSTKNDKRSILPRKLSKIGGIAINRKASLMTKEQTKKIDGLFDKLLERVEHEVGTEEHELTEEMASVVILLQEYKGEKSGSEGAEAIMQAIARNLAAGPRGEA
jgi:hypothetical protein